MNRLHIHVGVASLKDAIPFYSQLFATEPAKVKDDYAKWMLDDPALNFAISEKPGAVGVDHLGIQVDSEEGLAQIRERISKADAQVFDEGETQCCYAFSDKTWVRDPGGIAWEAFRTMGDATEYANRGANKEAALDASACCVPKAEKSNSCCAP